MPDQQLEHVKHAFDSAFRRMCEAGTVDDLAAELSNTLHHLYRLGQLCKDRMTPPLYYKALTSTSDLRAASAAMWARAFDAHKLFPVAKLGDMYSDYFTNMFRILVWEPLASLPVASNPPNYGQDSDYVKELEGKAILDTTRRSFDAMAALL